MAYLSTNIVTNATANLPCSGYGGLVFIKARRKHHIESDIFVQHNLAAFWNRNGLYPVCNGFDVPLLHSSAFPLTGLNNLAMGLFVFAETPKAEIRGRNLLTSEMAEDNQSINLFLTPECSDRKTVNMTNVAIKNPCVPSNRLLKLKYCGDSTQIKLEQPAVELRTSVFDDCKKKVFVRTDASLLLADFNETDNQLTTLYNKAVIEFLQIPNLEDDIAFLDCNGFLWHGTIGQDYGRRKLDFQPRTISGTDCPCVVIASDETSVHLVDFRENRGCHKIFEIDFAYCSNNANSDFPNTLNSLFANNREQMFHLSSLPERPFASVASTDRNHHLLDHRVPGEAVLTMAHSTLGGGDYVFTAPPLTDTEDNNFVYTYFSLSQCFSPQITYWPMYLHKTESLWASLGPERELPTPRIMLNHLEVVPGSRFRHFEESYLPKVTRSICYQQLPDESSLHNTRALIFRQFDGGDVWCSNFSISPHPDEAYPVVDLREQSLRNINAFFKKPTNKASFTPNNNLSKEFKIDPKSVIPVVSAVPNNLPKHFTFTEADLTTPLRHWSPFGSIGDVINPAPVDADELELVSNPPEDALFTNIVLRSWAKSDDCFRRYLNQESEASNNGYRDLSQNVSFFDSSGVGENALSTVQEENDDDNESELDFEALDVHSD